MTKEQMIAAISSLNVGDSRALEKRGGTFKDLLKEIVNSIPQGGNEPLIVEGTLDEKSFTPNEGQPSLEDAAQAIGEGRDVIICIPSAEGGNTYYHWLENNVLDGYIAFTQNIVW